MNLIYDNLDKIIALCKKYKVKNMYVFGSILTPRFNDDSDVDLLFNFNSEVNYNNYAENFFTLCDELKKTFGREVDLVDEHTIRNPYFKEEVDDTKKLIYG